MVTVTGGASCGSVLLCVAEHSPEALCGGVVVVLVFVYVSVLVNVCVFFFIVSSLYQYVLIPF